MFDNQLIKDEGDINISPYRKRWQKDNLSKNTKHWLAEDKKYFLQQSLSTPCLNVLKSSSGIYLEDLTEKKIMDFHGNNVHQVGFGNSHVIKNVIDQLQKLPFSTRRYTNLKVIELARKITELAPGDLNKVLLAPGGTTAVGIALKLARVTTGRFKTLSMWDSFHGASIDAISVGGESAFRKSIGPLLTGN
ncbi:MAG: aminotransferase class III-fold pyridoxal phosphate-dependent enzyme, partial [Halanaerobiales bacterium]